MTALQQLDALEARRGCRRTAETLRALLRQAARQMQTVSRCVALLIFTALAADAQTAPAMLHPYVVFTEPAKAAQLGIVSYKLYSTPDTNAPATGAAYIASVPVGTNACLIPDTVPLGATLWMTSVWTNSAGYNETAFTNTSSCPFQLNVAGPTFMGVILK